MRLLLYNIRYATGTGPAFHLPVPGAGYLRSNRKVLSGITEFIRSESPDVVGLVEVDTGSIRTGMLNQAQHIAGELGHYSTYQCKYGAGSINQLMPIVRKQLSMALMTLLRVTRLRGASHRVASTAALRERASTQRARPLRAPRTRR